MVNILPTKKGFSQQLFENVSNAGSQFPELLGGTEEAKQTKKLGQYFKENAGIDISQFPPDVRNEFAKQFAKSKAQEALFSQMFKKSPAPPSFQTDGTPTTNGSQEASLGGEGFDFESLDPEKKALFAQMFPNAARSLQKEEDLSLKRKKFEHTKDVKNEELLLKSYDAQKDFIDKTSNAYKSFESELKPKLMQMQNLNQDELIGPASAKFLETIGVPLGLLENPSNELYDKVSQDLLKGLPETYGNKILLAEVQNFLKTIPRLVNSPDGRRMIASNMLKLGEMREVLYKEMRKQQVDLLDKNQKFPKDFEQRIFDNVKPQIDRINREFVQLSQVKAVPKNTVPYFNPQGGVSFVPNDPQNIEWAEKNGGRRIW